MTGSYEADFALLIRPTDSALFLVNPGWREAPAIAHIGESRDSGFDASHRPGMTANTRPRSRGAKRPNFAGFVRPENKGAGNAGRSARPQPRVQW
jgi:hypothetical protein